NGQLPATTVDTTIAIPGIVINDTGISNTDNVTYDRKMTVTNLETGATWQYSLDGGATWTTGTGNTFNANTNTTYNSGQIQVRQTDIAGNTATGSNSATIVIDTTLTVPTLALAHDTGAGSNDGITRDGTVSVTNFDPDTVRWSYSINSGTTWITGAGSSFVVPEGVYPQGQIRVKVENLAGIESQAAYSGQVVVDQTVSTPIISINDTGISNTDNVTYDRTITVSNLDSDATWQYSLNGGVTWTTGTGNTFNANTNTTYNPGQIQVRQTDIAGNTATGSNSATIVIDTTLTVPTLALTNDTGAGSNDGITSDGTVNVTNFDPDTVRWSYSINGGTTWITGTGSSFVVPAGTYPQGQIRVKVENLAGIESQTAYSGQVVVDQTVSTPIISINDTGISNSDNVTSDRTIKVSNLDSDATWQYSLNGGMTWTTGTGNTFNANINTTYNPGQIQVRQTDVAGNTATGSNSATVVIDSTPPTASATITGMTSDTGIPNDWITTDRTLTINGSISGTLAVGEIIQISKDGGNTWITATVSGNTWSAVDPSILPFGNVTYQTRVVDSAGNIGLTTNSRTIQIVQLQAVQDVSTLTSLAEPVDASADKPNQQLGSGGFFVIRSGDSGGSIDSSTIGFTGGSSTSNTLTIKEGQVQSVEFNITGGSIFSIGGGTIGVKQYKLNPQTGVFELDRVEPNAGQYIAIGLGFATGKYNTILTEGSYYFELTFNGAEVAGLSGIYMNADPTKGTGKSYGDLLISGDVITNNTGGTDLHTGTVKVLNISSETVTTAKTLNQNLTNLAEPGKPAIMKYLSTEIQGQWGKLLITADGKYTYERDYTKASLGKVDTFTYTIQDQYGNTSTTNLHVQIKADGIVFDPNNPGADGTYVVNAVNDLVNTFSLVKTENTQKTYAGSSSSSAGNIGAVLVSPDNFVDRGSIDAYGNVSGVQKGYNSSASGDANYATISVDAKSIFTLDYYLSFVSGNVKIVVYKQVGSDWVVVSSGNTYTSSNAPGSSTPAHIAIYNDGDTSANYAVALEQSGISSSFTSNTVYFTNSYYTHTQVNFADNKLTQTSTIGGNVLTNDTGATFATSVLKVNSTNITGDQTIITGKYGTLRMDADGDYTYVLNSNVTRYDLGKQDVFTYTLDGSAQSNVTANLTFVVNAQGVITSNSSNVMNGTDRNYTESFNETYVSGNDLFLSGSANEIINGGTGNDTLIYNLLNNTDPTGGNGRDTWNNFTVAKVNSDNTNIDFIDVHGLLSDKGALTDTTILQFLSTTTVGNNTTLYIDRDGGGSVYSPTALLILNNVNTTIDELIKNHQILY
ncbi:hypothetical protein I6M90_15665, partial [Acinetobacter bereziniae]